MRNYASSLPRPLGISLARLSSAVAVAAALHCSTAPRGRAAIVTWDGGGGDARWTNPTNWSPDGVPAPGDDLSFGTGSPATVHLVGNQTGNSLTFTDNFALGAYGTNHVLTNSSGNITVNPGDFATIHAAYGGAGGLNLSGGGSLYLTNTLSNYTGGINIDGVGTSLVHRQEGPAVQYNGINSAQEFGRFDPVTLGFTTAVRNITLTNGGEFKIINTGNNPEGNFKNINIGLGGGTLNLGAGYVLQNLDDVGQIGVTSETFTKAGKGRLIITGATALAAANPLQGVVNINGGMLSLDAQVSQTVGANTYVRFLGIAGTGTTLNINNGGTLLVNNGTQATFDVPTINANDGSIIAVQGADHIFGYSVAGGASSVSNLNINGTVQFLNRDLFNPQQARLPRMRAVLGGTGTLEILGGTAAGSTTRFVIERGVGSTFSGTFRLLELNSLESNPRNNTVVDTGKTIGDGDVEFAGFGSTLDIRDSTATTSVFDYTTNEITVTTPQAGSVNTIAPIRAAAATGTGHLFNFGTLTMVNHRLAIAGNNSYQSGFADTASINGDAYLIMNADNGFAVFSNPAAISEGAAGRSLTILKSGVGNTAARDVISGGAISLSNLQIATGTLQLRGANGAITTGFGGAAPAITINGSGLAANGNTLPTQGLLHLDSNTGHVVGANTVFAAANNNDRIVDTANVTMRSNSILRLTSAGGVGTTETIGTPGGAGVFTVTGHATIDIVKTGTTTSPVALTINNPSPSNTATVNFTGSALGTAGANSSRVVIPLLPTGFMGAQFHQANEWAKYDATPDNGFAIGVTPFAATDYTIGSAENTWAPGQQIKQTATAITLTGNRNADRFNFQPTGTSTLNLAGFVLTSEQGGILSSTSVQGFKDGATAAAPSGAAGVTAGTSAAAAGLFVHANNTVEFHLPIINNPAGGPVTFVKSGTGTVVLSHQDRAVGAAQVGTGPFTTPTWSSTNTGGWVINDGMLNVHRGQFLGATPTTVTLNGGQLEINEPVSTANADSILPGWGHHIVVNGNAMIGNDDNGEANDGSTGDRTLVKLGSLTVNNGSLLGLAAFSDSDNAFMGGATFNGRPALNIGAGGRSGVNNANIISGNIAGAGFDVIALGGNGATLVLGGTQSDTASSTYNGTVTIYGATVRLNKANGITAITDGTAAEDVIINGGNLFWGPGHHGNLSTTNNVTTTNNGILGIAPTSPAAIKTAGMNQIADTATITLLTGGLGESDRITNEKFGTLIMRNGTFNVGLGTVEMDNAIFSGGTLNIDRGGTLKIGNASYLPGAFDQNVLTGLPTAGAFSTLEIGAGGISLTGQNIILGNGSNGNVAGAGSRLRLGGNLTFTGSDLIGGSYGRKGIFIQTGNTFRELGAGHIDLMGGVRDFNINTDSLFTITAPMINGGITKSGGGSLILEPYQPSAFAGPITVNAGILQAKGDGAFGTSAGGVTIANGATVKLDSSWIYGDDFTVSGPGSLIPGGGLAREAGALIGEIGTNRLTGAVILGSDATLAGNTFLDPSVTPATGGAAFRIGTLLISGPGGVTGAGNLTLSGPGDGIILNGVNTTAGGVIKDGAGRWTVSGGGTYLGPTTISAGQLQIGHGSGLGAAGAGTTVLGGSLELLGGITTAEPLTLHGAGSSIQSGALVSLGGNNTVLANTTLGSDATIRSEAGSLTLGNIMAGATANPGLTLSGAGGGVVNGAITTGAAGILTKNGTGTWALAGANTFGGATNLNGGVLSLNYAASNASKLSPTVPLTMGGGSLLINGSSVAATAQSVNGLNLIAGGAGITVESNGQPATLALGTITRAPGSTADFDRPALGAITTLAANTNGILGAYATTDGTTNWATVAGANIVPFTAYVPLSPATTATGNARVTSGQTAGGALTANSLKIENAGLVLGGGTLALTSGGLLYSGNGVSGISGTGLVSGPTLSDELIVHTAGGIFDVATPLIGGGSGSLTKTGPGTLTLRGASSFTGSINVNDGTLLIPGAPSFPGPLGTSVPGANRLINLNGGGFGILADWDINDWDATTGGIQSLQLNIGPGGGTLKALFGSNLIINDGSTTPGVATQLMGSGDLTFTGGGRYSLSGGTPQFLDFTGNTIVDGGMLTVGHSNSLGGRQAQTLTLKSDSAIINSTGFGLGQNGLPNNIIAEDGVQFFGLGGNRAFGGDLQLTGTSTIALMERDNAASERQLFFNGRVSGAAVTMNVFGVVNSTPFYLASGSNPVTGTINLNANAVLETRIPGSLGLNTGDVSINLLGANSRLLLRHFQNGDFRANVVVSENVEINSDRLVGYGGGGLQILSINNLTLNGDNKILTISGGNTYHTRVGGTATFNAPTKTILNVTASDLILENGLTFGTPGSTLDKRGGFSAILRGPTNHTGNLVIQGGVILLQDNGALAGTTAIDIRGGELRVDNSAVVNPNRINDAAPITLNGGALRITGQEIIGTVSAVSGTTQIAYNPTSDTVVSALTLPSFTRALGAIVQFQSDLVTTGATTLFSSRVSPRVLIPGQADSTQTIPGLLGNNNLDFIQYNGTTIDGGQPLGVRDMRNPGTANAPNYTDNTAETGWIDSLILRRTNPTDATVVTDTLTANRALDAIKVEAGGTNRDVVINMSTFNLRIDGGGIIDVGNTTHDLNINGTTGILTAGPATPGAGTAELVVGGSTGGTAFNINSIIGDNGTQPVALVKTGTNTLNLAGVNTYTGGTFVTSGTLNLTNNASLGAATNPISLSGGTLQFNIANAGTDVALGGLGQNVTVMSNSAIIMDNGTGGLDNNLAFGNLTISGGSTLAIRGFDSIDAAFTGTHAFSGAPTIDLNQATSGSNPNTAATASVVTLGGPITGSGFYVSSSGNVNDTAARLQIGSGATDTAANTYTGKVTILHASNTEDTFVELNKAPGTTAITGDLQLDGGTLLLNSDDQIADTSSIVNNRSILNFNGRNETIASLTMNGGGTITNATTGTPVANTITITGAVTVNGYDDFGGVTTGLTVGNNSTLNIGGLLSIGTFGRVHLAEGATGGVLNLNGGLEMTGGAFLNQSSGTGPNIVRLGGNVTTFGSPTAASLGNSNDSDTFLELNGTRTFTVADGGAGIDLTISTVMRNSTAPVAVGGFVKNGPGLVQIQGGATANSYTGPTVLNEGTLVLFKNAGVNSLGSGAATNPLTIGDGIGGAKADKVIVRNSNQIADATAVTIASSGLLDLQTFNTNETVASISGSGSIDLGPGSVLTTGDGNNTTFAGSIQGAGRITKQGSGSWTLSGNSDYAGFTDINGGKVVVTGVIDGSAIVVNASGTLGGTGSVNDVTVGSGGTLAPGISPGDLTAKGNTSFTPGSTFALEFNAPVPGTQYDQLTVGPNGTISITGGDVTLALGYTPALTQMFLVIDNQSASAISGRFTNLPQGGTISATFNAISYDFVANYQGGDGNDLVLTVVPEPTSGMIALASLCVTAGLRRFRRR